MLKESIHNGQVAEVIHGGTGKAVVRRLFWGKLSTPLFVYYLVLPPESTVGSHKHVGSEEIYCFLEGKGVMTVDDNELIVGPGDAILTKTGSSHALRNVGEIDIRAIVIIGIVNRFQFLINHLISMFYKFFRPKGENS